MTPSLPTAMGALATVTRLTLLRLRRGRGAWIGGAIALLPIAFAISVSRTRVLHYTFSVELLVLAVVAALFLASSIGEEIEGRTITYLSSRPLPRWTILIGKLIAFAPIVLAMVVVSWIVAVRLGLGQLPPLRSVIGLGIGSLAVCAIVAGIAAVVPSYSMPLAIVYLGVDFVVGQIPASLQLLSITHQTTALAGIVDEPIAISAISITLIAALWLALGIVRMRRLEA